MCSEVHLEQMCQGSSMQTTQLPAHCTTYQYMPATRQTDIQRVDRVSLDTCNAQPSSRIYLKQKSECWTGLHCLLC